MKHLLSMTLVLLLLPQVVIAEQNRIACSDIADATERLACFDRTFPRDTDPRVPEAPVAPNAGLQSPIESTKVAGPKVESPEAPTAPLAPPTAVVTSPATTPAQTNAGMPSSSLFGAKDKVSINSRLKSVRNADKQKMVFLLENDQIWLQNSPRSLPFKKGQDVTIKSGIVGGYSLSNSEGVSTRVRRIK